MANPIQEPSLGLGQEVADATQRPRNPGHPEDALRKIQRPGDRRPAGPLSQLVRSRGLPQRRDRPPAAVDAGDRSQRAEGYFEADTWAGWGVILLVDICRTVLKKTVRDK